MTARNGLATAYLAAGRLDEAIDLFVDNFVRRKRVLGASHPDTKTSRLNVIAAYRSAGRLDEAEAAEGDS